MSESQAATIPAAATAQNGVLAAAKPDSPSLPVERTEAASTPAEVTHAQHGETGIPVNGSPPTASPAPHVSFKTPAVLDGPRTSWHPQPDSTTSSSVSEFQSFIPTVPWQPGFWTGAGINAFTGQVEAQAVVPFKLVSNEIKQSREVFTAIHYESNLMQELSASAGAGITMNIGIVGLGVDASASLVSRAKVSATSSSILATYVTTYNSDFDLTSEYKLKPEAAELARNDPAEFRRRHGDYFIAGGQRTSTFTALLIFSCTNTETLKKFSMNVTTSVSELFKLVGSSSWTEEAKQAKVDVKVFVEMRGYTGSGFMEGANAGGDWDASKVAGALDWFKTHEVGDYSTARLQHYSALDPNISRTIPISGDIFKDIRRLHLLIRSISILSGSCPQTRDMESTKLVADSSELTQDVDAHQNALAVDSSMCAEFLEKANVLHEQLSAIHRRYSFWVQVLNKIPEQPLYRIVAEKNQQIWSYGFSYIPDSSIGILFTEHRHVLPWTFSPFHRDETLSYDDAGRLIVGWKVISVRKDGHNGSWRKLSRNVLLSNSARIIFRTQRFRAAEWKFVTYHVDRQMYNFSATGMDVPIEDDTDEATRADPLAALRKKNNLPGMGGI